ncbi:hypothetical protein Tco_0764714 [Tanacetum coccineum]
MFHLPLHPPEFRSTVGPHVWPSSYKTPSPSSSPTLPVHKRYRGTSKLILDTDSDGDELGEEDTEEDEEDESSDVDDERERESGAARRRALESTEDIAPSTYKVGQRSRSMPEKEGAERISAFRQPTLVTWTPPFPEWSLGSLPVSPSSLVVPSPIASPVATPSATISCLDALPPTLFEGYDRDLRELYTRSGAVRDEIFSQRAALWHAIYDIQRENHDLRRQLAEERRAILSGEYSGATTISGKNSDRAPKHSPPPDLLDPLVHAPPRALSITNTTLPPPPAATSPPLPPHSNITTAAPHQAAATAAVTSPLPDPPHHFHHTIYTTIIISSPP